MSVIGFKKKKFFAFLMVSGLIPALFADSTLVKIKSAEGNSVLGQYKAKNVFDNIVSDKSRWVNAKGKNKTPELIMNFTKNSDVSGVHLYSGFGKRNAVKDFIIQSKNSNGIWKNIIKVSNNKKTAVAIKFPKSVKTTALKFIFTKTDDNLARIKEIKVIKATDKAFPNIGAGKTAVKKNNGKSDLWIDKATFSNDMIVVDSIINIPFKNGNYKLQVSMKNFKFSVADKTGKIIIPNHPLSGLYFSGGKAMTGKMVEITIGNGSAVFEVINSKNKKAKVTVATTANNIIKFTVTPADKDTKRIVLNAGAEGVAHGLGDSGGFHEKFDLTSRRRNYKIVNSGGGLRFASSFVIFPQSGYAGVHFTDGTKNVLLDGQSKSYEMAIDGVNSSDFYYLIGDNKTIYKNYKALRNSQGFDDIYPKSQLFELGWETWDALGWNTNEKTVKSMLQTFLKRGYPIRWAVTGSGFWENGGTTTSFGKFGKKFSNPKKLKTWMNNNKIAWMIGFRTNLVPSGGPYYPKSKKRDGNLKVKSFNGNPVSAEAVRKKYFIKDSNGIARKYTSGVFPIVPCYLVDGRVKGSSQWFLKQFKKWDIDGIKEDTMMNLRGNINVFNGPISALAKAKENYLIMARCGAFSSPGTLLRINDTGGASSMQRRTPLNYMQYAVCGAPNVYSDTIGFHRMRDRVSSTRLAWMQAMTAGIAVGALPKGWSAEEEAKLKKAIMFRYALTPYFYNAAVKSYNSGYPYTLTPLTIAYPNDSKAKHLPNYQWLIGESILAAPLLKNYKNNKLDIYLPEGKWIDYDSNKVYQGKQMLKDFAMPLGKTPVFIGGKGIIVLRKNDNAPLTAKIYPTANTENNVYQFTYLNGKDKTTIKYGKMTNAEPSKLKVINCTTNKSVKFSIDSNSKAINFIIKPKNNYKVIKK